MTALWTATEAARATGGAVAGAWEATGISIDTRTLEPGDLFVPLPGENFDGHRFVPDALKSGAAACMVGHPIDGVDAEHLLIVDSPVDGLRALARTSRSRTDAKVIGVTGSVGKTGVKEAIAHALGRQGSCHATRGNLNNHYGLPITLARMPASTNYAVLEMGMNASGEIEALSRMAQPHVAVITAVEAVHLEFFSSVAAIADAKAEIFLGLSGASTAILPRDNEHYPRLLDHARHRGAAEIVSFGRHPGAEYRLVEAIPKDTGTQVIADIRGRDIRLTLSQPGEHHAINACAVLAAIHAVGADVDAAAASMTDITPLPGRGAVTQIARAGGSFKLVDESYNAGPASMTAAIKALGLSNPDSGGRRIAVLGDMLELGEASEDLHRDLAQSIAEAGIDLVYANGPAMAHLMDVLPDAKKGGWAATSQELAPLVHEACKPGDIVLIKGSLGSRMATIVKHLSLTEPRSQPADRVGAAA
ncbi:MAG: UDP-N-acetylmuramoyl-tripeptide--D-alanyl-D-alanine ligase [Pseudomonadota bacterium]